MADIFNLTCGDFHKLDLAGDIRKTWPDLLAQIIGDPYSPDPHGLPQLNRALRDFYQQRSVLLQSQQLLVTAGSSESYRIIFETCAKPGDVILTPVPGYPLLEDLARAAGLHPRHYQLKPIAGWPIDLDDFANQVHTYFPALVIAVSPGNPTGCVHSRQELQHLGEICAQVGAGLVWDEVFWGLFFDKGPEHAIAHPFELNLPELRILCLNGLSKMGHSPDLKVSWIAQRGLSTSESESLEYHNDNYLSCSPLNQALAPSLLSAATSLQQRLLPILEANRRELLRRLSPGWHYIPGEGGIHCCLWHPPHWQIHPKLRVDPGTLYNLQDKNSLVISLLHEPDQFSKALGYLFKPEVHGQLQHFDLL